MPPRIADGNIRSLISFQSVFNLMAKGRNKRPISPCVSMWAGRAVQAGPFAPWAQRRDQFDFGANSIFAVPIERQNPAIAQPRL